MDCDMVSAGKSNHMNWINKRYRLKRLLLQLVIWLPAPRLLQKLCRFYSETRLAENFADMTINGEVRFLRSQAAACTVLFDVGASRGEWTRFALAAAEQAEIHCFEPLQSFYEMLEDSRFPSRVICNKLGLSDEEGSHQINARTTSLYGNRLERTATEAGDEMETIHLTTLDTYCAEKGIEQIDFLKVDVEGHELAVLRGGRKMIEAGRILRIQFEYGPWNIHSRVLLHDLFAFFEGLPFRLYKLTPHGPVPVPTNPTRLENFQYKNFVAIHQRASKIVS